MCENESVKTTDVKVCQVRSHFYTVYATFYNVLQSTYAIGSNKETINNPINN